MPNLPLVGSAYKQDSLTLNAQDCVNLFITKDERNPSLQTQDSKIVSALRSTPGCTSLADTSKALCRGMIQDDNYIYAVYGNTFYEIEVTSTSTPAVTVTSRGTLNTSTGDVSIAQSLVEIMIVDGTNGYLYTKSSQAFATITDADYNDDSTEVIYLNGYFVVPKAGVDSLWSSDLLDGSSWNALNFATAERFGDKIVALEIARGELWAFGSVSTEIFASDATATAFPFSVVEGVDLKIGCSQAKSVLNIDDFLFWLDHRGMVVMAAGYDVRPISTIPITTAIQSYSDKTCHAFAMYYAGCRFYCLSFDNQATTWCFCLDTQEWHEMKSTLDDQSVDSQLAENYQDRYLINKTVLHKGLMIGGSWNDGNVYHISLDYYTDNTQPIIRQRTSAHFFNDFKYIHVAKVELQFEMGVGVVTGQGSDPQVMFQYSKDRGHTWSNELWRSFGKIGEYNTRVRWNRLGTAKSWTFRIKISDPVPVTIIESSWSGK